MMRWSRLRRLVLAPFALAAAVACVDVPDLDSPLQFMCETDDDCLEDYECGSNGFCQGRPGEGCSSEAGTICEDVDVWWVDSCGDPHAVKELCLDATPCCGVSTGEAACEACF